MADKQTPKKKEFGTPPKVLNVVKAMQDVERTRAQDRALIDALFNGQRPYSDEEVQKFNIQVNVNWGAGKRIMRDANTQLNNALIHTGSLFTSTLRDGPVDKIDEWSQQFTKNLHIPLQEGISGKRNFFLIKNRNASVALHGIGALMWSSPTRALPRFVALEELLIPTDTTVDFANMRYFAVNLNLSIGELIDLTRNDDVLGGWNKEMIKDILDSQVGIYNESTPSNWRDQPEDMVQVYFQNRGYYYSDATPKVRCVQFFYQEMDAPKKWYRVIYLKEDSGGKVRDMDKKFLFDGTDTPFADDIGQILNVQYGDGNLVPPLKYHNVRGLGVDLYAPVETDNRLRCDFVQSVFEHMKMYFRIKDPADRDRLKAQILQQYGFIQDGLQIVKREDRHQIDANLVQDAMGQMGEVMQESASSFVPGETGSERTMTAKEVTIRANQASVLVSSMIASMYLQEGFYYEELKRRFCMKDATDPVIVEFRKRCIADGIPEEFLEASRWKIVPERVLGGGDTTKAQSQAQWLLTIKPQLGPAEQQIALREAVSTMLEDPAKARMYVPIAPPQSSPGSEMAEQLFGTMMLGVQVAPRKGIDLQGYVAQLLKMMGEVVQRIESMDGMGTLQEVVGLATVAQNIQQYIEVLAQDGNEKQNVKEFGDALGKMMNMVKAFGQRIQEKQQADEVKENIDISYNDAPPDIKRQMEQAAGFQPSQMQQPEDLSAAKDMQDMQLKGAEHQQKMQITSESFASEEARKNAAVASQIQREKTKAAHDMMLAKVKAVSDAQSKMQAAKHKPEKKN